MGGVNSGRKPDPKKVTLQERQERQAAKVTQLFTQPRLDSVPDPELPMNDRGRLKYRELAESLLKAGQLTMITRGYAETAAIAFQQIYKLQEEGRDVRATLITQYNRALSNLQQLDVDKKTVQEAQRENKFKISGFSARLR